MRNFLAVFTAFAVLTGSAAGEETSRRETLTFEVGSGDYVKLYNINGDLSVQEWASSELELSYVITVSDPSSLELVSVVCETDGGLDCSVEYDEEWDYIGDSSVDFTLKMPEGTDLDLEVAFVSGDVELNGGSGTARLELVSGDMIIGHFNGGIHATLVSGNLEALVSSGLRSVEIVNGSMDLLVDDLGDDLDISAVSADVILRLITDARVTVETISGGIEVAEGFGATVSENYIGRSSEFGSGEHLIAIGTVSGKVTVTD